MKRTAFLAVLLVSLAAGQYVESTFRLPDSIQMRWPERLVSVDCDSTLWVGCRFFPYVVVVDPAGPAKLGLVESVTGIEYLPSMAYNPNDDKVYMTVGREQPDSTLLVFDAVTRRLIHALDAGPSPSDLVFCTASNRLYCQDYFGKLAIIDGTTDEVRDTLDIGPVMHGLALDSVGNRVFCLSDSGVAAVDCFGDSVLVRSSWSHDRHLAICYSASSNKVYVSVQGDSWAVLDGDSLSLHSAIQPGLGARILLSYPELNRVYAASGPVVLALDCAGDEVVHWLELGPWMDVVDLDADAAAGRVLCACEHRTNWDSLVVINATRGTVAGRYPGNPGPRSVLADSRSGRGFMACGYISGWALTVLDMHGDTLLKPVVRGDMVHDFVHHPTLDRLYCQTWMANHLLSVDCSSGSARSRLEYQLAPPVMGFNPDNDKVYCSDGPGVSVVDCLTDTVVAYVLTDWEIDAICHTKQQDWVYVADGNDITVIDGVTNGVVAVIDPGPRNNPNVLCYNPLHDKVYSGNTYGYNESVDVFDCATNRLRRCLRFDDAPQFIVHSVVQDKVFVVFEEWGNEAFAVIDGAGDYVRARLPMASYTGDVLVTENVGKVFVADTMHDCVHVVDAVADTVWRQSVRVGEAPRALAYDTTRRRLYVANRLSGDVSVVDAATHVVVATLDVAESPSAAYWSPENDRVYIGCREGTAICVLRDTTVIGIHEQEPYPVPRWSGPTIMGGPELLQMDCVVLDIQGRDVTEEKARLAPGVYFVGEGPRGRGSKGSRVRKVILQR